MNRTEVIKEIEDRKVIAILRGLQFREASDTVEALLKGGIRILELPFNLKNPESWEQTAETIRFIREKYHDDVIAGAGTVTSKRLAELAFEHGAEIIVSPDTRKEVIEFTRKSEMVSIPGAMTPTEILDADSYGADFIKIFPAGILGCNYLKAVKGPINHLKLMAVGGINEKNALEYLKAGYAGVGVGCLGDRSLIENGKYQDLMLRAKKLCGIAD